MIAVVLLRLVVLPWFEDDSEGGWFIEEAIRGPLVLPVGGHVQPPLGQRSVKTKNLNMIENIAFPVEYSSSSRGNLLQVILLTLLLFTPRLQQLYFFATLCTF